MFPKQNHIKIKSLCLLLWEDKLFVSEMYDSVKKSKYYRPIGGTVEFGEQTIETLQREIKEELDADIEKIELVQVIENLFVCDGNQGHEIVYLYKAQFSDSTFYQNKEFTLTESNGEKIAAHWLPISKFVSKEMRLVPEEVINLLL